MANSPPRMTQIPPPGRPYWTQSGRSAWDLLFLSWGARRYGDQPLPVAMHEGWVYVAFLEGAPVAVLAKGRRRAAAPCLCIFHPDCAYGWKDLPGRRCRMLCWEWKGPPEHAALRPKPGGFIDIELDRLAVRTLERVHRDCRRAVAVPDELSSLLLRRSRLDLDLTLAQRAGTATRADADVRLALAVRFLEHHAAERDPVAKLGEYLQVAPGTLKALFQRRLGLSPRAFALKLRMEQARRRLTEGALVKEVATELGYRHANDLSRAFARHFGTGIRAAKRNAT